MPRTIGGISDYVINKSNWKVSNEYSAHSCFIQRRRKKNWKRWAIFDHFKALFIDPISVQSRYGNGRFAIDCRFRCGYLIRQKFFSDVFIDQLCDWIISTGTKNVEDIFFFVKLLTFIPSLHLHSYSPKNVANSWQQILTKAFHRKKKTSEEHF